MSLANERPAIYLRATYGAPGRMSPSGRGSRHTEMCTLIDLRAPECSHGSDNLTICEENAIRHRHWESMGITGNIISPPVGHDAIRYDDGVCPSSTAVQAEARRARG